MTDRDLDAIAQREPLCVGPFSSLRVLLTMAERDALVQMATLASRQRWQPMSTAPKDGTPILVHFNRIGTWQVFWSEEPFGKGIGAWCMTDNKTEDRPLRGYLRQDERGWMPLPAPPSEDR